MKISKKYKEIILYIFFGGIAFLISVLSFLFFYRVIGANELLANFISWNMAVIFAFITNRKWVFETKDTDKKSHKRLISFYFGRIFTLILEELIIFIFITRMRFPDVPVKVAAQVLVVVLNYFISKFIVFRISDRTDKAEE